MAGGVHRACVDEEDGGFTVALADFGCGFAVGGEMNVLAIGGVEAGGADGVEEARGRAMKKDVRRRHGR